MVLLQHYLKDGANYQARATLMYLQSNPNIEESWNQEYKCYQAEIKVGRWENGREQGYVVSLINQDREQLNIAFFEHRNIDTIHAIKWLQNSINSINIDNAIFDDLYKNKNDTSHSVGYGKANEMADWIMNELKIHWVKSMKDTQ